MLQVQSMLFVLHRCQVSSSLEQKKNKKCGTDEDWEKQGNDLFALQESHHEEGLICDLWYKKEKRLILAVIPVVHLSFHTAVLNPLSQTHTHLRVYAVTFPNQPVPINSNESFWQAFQS